MRRVPIAIAWIVLTALITDSVLHDPDVHPLASRGYQRFRLAASSAVDRVVARVSASPDHARDEETASSDVGPGRTHSPDGHWYWSTIATVAIAGIWLVRLALTVTFRNRSGPADHDAPLSEGQRP